jgi:hypothetical protein
VITDVARYIRELYPVEEFVGHAVAQLVEALRYKPEGRWFDSLA